MVVKLNIMTELILKRELMYEKYSKLNIKEWIFITTTRKLVMQ